MGYERKAEDHEMYHKIIMIGNLGADPQLRYTPQGTPVASFNVATNRNWTDKEGQRHDETVWFRATAWNKLAEVANEFLAKGRKVYVEGRLNSDDNGAPRVWLGKDGVHRASYEVTVETLKFVDGKESNGQAEQAEPALAEPLPDDDIPF
jgi:single-strand DNA-binding protein